MSCSSAKFATIGDRDCADAILQNFRQKLCFRTEDQATLDYFNRLICKAAPFLVLLIMRKILKHLAVYFFKTDGGTEPVRDWLKALSPADRKTMGDDIKTVQFGWPLGMPLVRSLGQGLWEVRSTLTGGKIARVFFFMANNAMVLVNGFIKKTQKAPQAEIDLALQRKKQYERYL